MRRLEPRHLALALALALAACGPGGRDDDPASDGGVPLPDARFDGTLSVVINGKSYQPKNVIASYRGAANAVIITSQITCDDCELDGLVEIGLRQPGPTDCFNGSGVSVTAHDVFRGGTYGSPGDEPCGLTVDAYGTDFGARVAGRFEGEMSLDEIGQPMTVQATVIWDVTL